jgi:iduronate 2-sulfatase
MGRSNTIMTRLTAFLSLAALAASAIPPASAQPKINKQKKRYNVLMIISDDLRPELPSYGNRIIKTPNIERIAARATRFDRAYTQYPLCNPSRTSFLTGRYPTQHKIYNSNDYFRRKHPDWVTLPQYFKQNGYVTIRSGKIFHGGIDDQVSWTVGGEPTDPAITERARVTPGINNRQPGSDRIVVLEGDGSQHGDYRTATRAIDYLDKYKDQPFFLAVGFVKPHSPPTAPQSFFDLYDANKMQLPVDFGTTPKAPPGLPEVSISPRNADLFIGRESPPDLAREMMRAYYASTSFMDAQVGRVLDALEKSGQKENTIVIFFGDHGYHLGEKGKWSKAYSLYEINLRVPLYIAVPNGKTQTSPRPVQLQDLYPTLAALCGLNPPPGIEGQDISPLLKNPKAKWNYPAYSMMEMQNTLGHSIRRDNWHYVEYNQGTLGHMLFDIEKDPHELKNLADDPKYAKTVEELRKELRKMPGAF